MGFSASELPYILVWGGAGAGGRADFKRRIFKKDN